MGQPEEDPEGAAGAAAATTATAARVSATSGQPAFLPGPRPTGSGRPPAASALCFFVLTSPSRPESCPATSNPPGNQGLPQGPPGAGLPARPFQGAEASREVGGRRPWLAPQAAASPGVGGGRRPDRTLRGELSPALPRLARALRPQPHSEACGEGAFPPHPSGLRATNRGLRRPRARRLCPRLPTTPAVFPHACRAVLPPTSPSRSSPTLQGLILQKAALRHLGLAPVSL